MAFRVICLKKTSACPKCGGLKGFKFYRKVWTKFLGIWGGRIEEAKRQDNSTSTHENKTVVCLDCDIRLTLIKEEK